MRIVLPLVLALVLAVPAFAAPGGPGGPGGPGKPGPGMMKPCTDVRQALRAPNGARCELVGHLDSRGPERFEFSDRSGSVPVRIRPGALKGPHVPPKASAKIFGTVRQDHGRTEIDVDRVDIR